MGAAVVTTRELSKRFGARRAAVDAVRGVDLEVAGGSVFGLLGPNGAGKSTVMRMLCTLLTPTSGSATVCGLDLMKQQREVRPHIGYVGQKGGLEDVSTGRENLVLQARLYGMSAHEAARAVDGLIERLGLSAFADRRTQTYSGGQRRLFDLACGIVHRPELLFLDEPTAGLDPTSRARVWDEVRTVHAAGTTIFLTTHYLEEADLLCDRVAIMNEGRVAACDAPAELKKRVSGDSISFGYETLASAQAAAALLAADPAVLDLQVIGLATVVHVNDGEAALPPMMRVLGRGNCAPHYVHLARPTLDDVFLSLTGRTLHDPESGG